MRRKKLLLLVLVLLSFAVKSQTLSVAEVDRKTYELYLKQDWKQLKKLGNQAIKSGIDFYYLRARIALAYYNTKQYRIAAKHFEKLLEFNRQDEFATEYLYWSYLLGGQTEDAYKLFWKMPLDLKQKNGLTNRNLRNWGIYYTYAYVPNSEALYFSDLDGQANIKGEQELNLYLSVPAVSFSWASEYGLRSFSYSFYSFSNISRTQENNQPVEEKTLYEKQHQFNYVYLKSLNPDFDFVQNYALIPVFYTQYSQVIVNRGRWSGATTVSYTRLMLNAVGTWGIKYKRPYFDILADVSLQFLNTEPSVQMQFSPTVYPFGNLNLYFTPTIVLKQGTGGFENLTAAKAGLNLFGSIWLEGGIWHGNISNFNYNLSAFVFNSQENIKNRYFLNFYFVSKKFTVNLSYSFYDKDRFIIYENPDRTEISLPYALNTHSFTVGFSFIPDRFKH